MKAKRSSRMIMTAAVAGIVALSLVSTSVPILADEYSPERYKEEESGVAAAGELQYDSGTIVTTAEEVGNEASAEESTLIKDGVITESSDAELEECVSDTDSVDQIEALQAGSSGNFGDVKWAYNDKTGELREVFLNRGSSGGCNNFMIGFSRLLSLSARAGVSLDDILDQLDSTGICPSYAVRSAKKHDTSKGSCCPMAVGNALRDMHEEMLSKINPEKEEKEPEKKKTIKKIKPSNMGIDTIGGICPECGDICKNCGWSKCL